MSKVMGIVLAGALAVSGSVFAQVDEKQGQTPKDPAVLASVLGAAAASTSGNLTGGPTYDRIFTGDVQNDCTATSTVSGAGTGVEYALVPVYSPTGATLVASLDNPGTDIGDTVLSLYCDPFNDADATQNLVAYDDDGGSGLLSAFDGSEGILLAPGEQYFLVVSLFSPGSIGGGNYELTASGLNGGTVLFGPALPEVNNVPALGPIGLGVMVLLMAGLAIFGIRRFA